MLTRMMLAGAMAMVGGSGASAQPASVPSLDTTGTEMGVAMVAVVGEGGAVVGMSVSAASGPEGTNFDRQVMGTIVDGEWAIGTRVTTTTGPGGCTTDIARTEAPFESAVVDCTLIGLPPG